jgi:hypothetical protein
MDMNTANAIWALGVPLIGGLALLWWALSTDGFNRKLR